MKCKALNSSRLPCRSHASRSGSGFCSFHEPPRRELDPWHTLEGQRAALFAQAFNILDRAIRESRIPDGSDTKILVTEDLLWIAERFLEAWLPWPIFAVTSVQIGLPPPPEGAEEYTAHLRDAALEIVTSDPRLGAAN